MLSIIIPSYNYPVYDLVRELYSQCTALNIHFEILVRDDCSKNQFTNIKINQLSNCFYSISNKNIGLSQTRNYLITQANYPYILLLDNDVYPQNRYYIENYLKHIDFNSHIYYGGIAYKREKPKNNEMLRWVYGINREEQIAKVRATKTPSLFLCSNTLFSKDVFNIITFDDTIKNYGYEDLLFSKRALENKFIVKHLNNSVWHLKLDTSLMYLIKTETAIKTLKTLINEHKLSFEDTGFSKLYLKLQNKNLIQTLRLVNKIFNFSKILKYNLVSKKPNLKCFDLYRLLYFDELMRR